MAFKYDRAGVFRDGRAAVMRNGLYGYIDKTGREVVPVKYGHGADFDRGLALVQNGSFYGYIGLDGTEYWKDR